MTDSSPLGLTEEAGSESLSTVESDSDTVISPGEVRPLRRDASENRERVLRAASQLFAAQGLEASVEEIAQLAGVGMGTLYRRFPNKEALIEQLVDDLYVRVLAAAREAHATGDAGGLESFIRATARLQEEHRGCMARVWSGPVPEALVAELDEIVAQLLARAQAAGLIRADCTATDVSVLFWAIRGVIESGREIAAHSWQRHVDIVLAGMRPGADLATHPPLTHEQRLAVNSLRRQAS
jgi:AcrR family transcriptional regulator